MKGDHTRLLNIVVEGPDGAGKTTLIDALNRRFCSIIAPRVSAFELIPKCNIKKQEWYQTEDPFVTTRIYLSAQQKRFTFQKNYFNREHFSLCYSTRFGKPPLVLWDRGPLSAKAFSFACLKGRTQLPDELIDAYISLQFPNVELIPGIKILICPKNAAESKNLITRIKSDEDPLIEEELIYWQTYYINKKIGQTDDYIIFDPFSDPNKIFSAIEKAIENKLEEMCQINNQSVKPEGRPAQRLLLGQLLDRLSALKFRGEVTIVGGIIQKGYSDNDIDIIVKEECDLESIKKAVGENWVPYVHIKTYVDAEKKELDSFWKMSLGGTTSEN